MTEVGIREAARMLNAGGDSEHLENVWDPQGDVK